MTPAAANRVGHRMLDCELHLPGRCTFHAAYRIRAHGGTETAVCPACLAALETASVDGKVEVVEDFCE
jgi:hypothetical protein